MACLLIGGLTLGACQSISNGSENSSNSEVREIESLSPRVMDSGECGLFVWQIDPTPKLVLFSQTENLMADYWDGQAEVKIERQSMDGLEEFGQAPIQTFKDANERDIQLELRNPLSVDNGTRFQNGALTTIQLDGWEKVTPVIGMAACNRAPIASDYSERTIR